MGKQEWQYKARNPDASLFATSYRAEGGNTKAVLFFHHGINEHVGRYQKVFETLNSRGIDCHSYDMRSYGKSEPDAKQRGKITDFERLVNDFVAFCKLVQQEQYSSGVPPMFIGGQSLGGLIASTAALQLQSSCAGLILTSPAMDVDKNLILHVQSALAGPLSAAMPWARIVPAVKTEHLSEDLEVQKDYEQDPLNFPGNIRVRTARQCQMGMQRLKRHYKDIKVPVLGIHGDADKCTSCPAHERFMNAIGSADKTLHKVPKGYHELLKGPQQAEVLQRVAEWIVDRSSSAQSRSAL